MPGLRATSSAPSARPAPTVAFRRDVAAEPEVFVERVAYGGKDEIGRERRQWSGRRHRAAPGSSAGARGERFGCSPIASKSASVMKVRRASAGSAFG